MNNIDINFDFTTDTPKFWNNFWNNNDGFGAGSNDPDKKISNITQLSPDFMEQKTTKWSVYES